MTKIKISLGILADNFGLVAISWVAKFMFILN